MFSNEIEFDRCIITIMDDTGLHEDVKIHLLDDAVYIIQYDEDEDGYTDDDLIKMTPKMFNELVYALGESEGVFKVD